MTGRWRNRVLLIGPKLILGWTESTAKALEALGCAVTTIFYNQSLARQRVGNLSRISTRLGSCHFRTPFIIQELFALWLCARKRRVIVETAKVLKPDLVLILKGESIPARTLAELKADTGATLAVWWVDHPFMNAEHRHPWRHVPACVPLFDHCFIFDHSYKDSLRQAGAREVSFLPCAADTELFRSQRLTEAERVTYGASVSLVGVYTESRAKIVRKMCGMPGLGLWGPGWKELLSQQMHQDAFRGEALAPADACKVYSASQVNLNTHHQQSRNAGLNTRAFEIPAAGAFELSDYVPGMEALLEPGREVAVYHSPEQAGELARYYIKAEDERRRIAEAGHRRVLAEHTYRHRMQDLLSALSA